MKSARRICRILAVIAGFAAIYFTLQNMELRPVLISFFSAFVLGQIASAIKDEE